MVKTIDKKSKLVSKVKSSDRKAELEAGLEDVMNRERAINSQEVISKNKINEMKGKIIQSVFEVMKEFGVDGSNLESINLFLAKLEKQSPDLLQLFELIFSNLVGGPEDQGQGTTPGVGTTTDPAILGTSGNQTPPGMQGIEGTTDNAGLMNNYKNLAQKTMMPR